MDFIQVTKQAFTEDFCDSIMEKMDAAFEHGYGHSRQEDQDVHSHVIQDSQLFAHQIIESSFCLPPETSQYFNDVFWGALYKEYADKFSILKDMSAHTIYGNKLQRTDIGQGYHVWHGEHSSGKESGRVLLYILYLNDVDEGGETEFLYQHKRIKPEKGTLIIAPAFFTHAHRGNPPISNSKYIMTGWVEY